MLFLLRELLMTQAELVRSTIYLSPDLHQALRLKSAQSRRSMSEIVNEALRQSLREDQEDLAEASSRLRESAMGYEDFLA